jgi:hypothetical protein
MVTSLRDKNEIGCAAHESLIACNFNKRAIYYNFVLKLHACDYLI